MNVAIRLEGENLSKAFQITRPLQSLFHDKPFWLKKLGQHGLTNLAGAEMEVPKLRHIYQHRVRTNEAIKMRKTPLCGVATDSLNRLPCQCMGQYPLSVEDTILLQLLECVSSTQFKVF